MHPGEPPALPTFVSLVEDQTGQYPGPHAFFMSFRLGGDFKR
jgi:hypothetical protein